MSLSAKATPMSLSGVSPLNGLFTVWQIVWLYNAIIRSHRSSPVKSMSSVCDPRLCYSFVLFVCVLSLSSSFVARRSVWPNWKAAKSNLPNSLNGMSISSKCLESASKPSTMSFGLIDCLRLTTSASVNLRLDTSCFVSLHESFQMAYLHLR